MILALEVKLVLYYMLLTCNYKASRVESTNGDFYSTGVYLSRLYFLLIRSRYTSPRVIIHPSNIPIPCTHPAKPRFQPPFLPFLLFARTFVAWRAKSLPHMQANLQSIFQIGGA